MKKVILFVWIVFFAGLLFGEVVVYDKNDPILRKYGYLSLEDVTAMSEQDKNRFNILEFYSPRSINLNDFGPEIITDANNSFDITVENDIEEEDGTVTTEVTTFAIVSLTRFLGNNGEINVVSSVKNQGYGDCAKFAGTAMMEIELSIQYLAQYENARTITSANGGDINNVEINLSEAFYNEVNGCHNAPNIEMLLNRGLVFEEHYPYKQHSRIDFLRNATRFGTHPVTGQYKAITMDDTEVECTNGTAEADRNASWNHFLWDISVNNGWIRFHPTDYVSYTNTESEEEIKSLIRRGHPVYLSHAIGKRTETYYERLTVGNLGGNFENLIKVEWNADTDLSGGHGVAIIGYAKDQSTNLNYWLVKNSWGDSRKLWLIPFNSNYDPANDPHNNPIIGEKISGYAVFKNGIQAFGGQNQINIINIDTDGDGIIDLFDNASFCNIYSTNPNIMNCANAAQNGYR